MISPLANIDPSAKIGKNVTIAPFVVIQGDVEIGDDCEIMAYTIIVHGTRIGKNNKIYSSCVIGADPQDFRWNGEESFCYIGDNNIIREHNIINRGIDPSKGTRIGNECVIMAQSHIGHDTIMDDYCLIGNGVRIAGDVEIGTCTILSSSVVVHEGCHIGEWAFVKGGARVNSNVPPYVIVAHNPIEFFGVNAVIMRKYKYNADEVNVAARSYRHLYQTRTSVFNALKRIEADVEPSPIRDNIIKFIRENNNQLVAIPREMSV
ncbi:MAG: acyl-ACP--UDP-N-acetylglucosamine O-acyltransferase [Muribaculaceae bacterium]|nr:acyl-ACP--UDP-N-acetylglucosamine O-acyltransferase [Muribaculaceae bacterium]